MIDSNGGLLISSQGLSVHYPGCDALKDVNLQVQRGTVFALLGENGAGKTTLIRVLMGFLHPTAGSAEVMGLDPTRDALEIRRRVGYVADAPAFYDWMTVAETGWFASSFYPEGFWDNFRRLIASYQVPEQRSIKQLSKGQRAKVSLALALAHDPELLILDEPTSGLDPLVRREVLESLLDRVSVGCTVLLSSHQIVEVERIADHIAILQQGKIVLTSSLPALRESFLELTLGLNDPLISLPAFEQPTEILRTTASGRQQQWIVRNLSSEQLEALRRIDGVQHVATHVPSLEELYAACLGRTPHSDLAVPENDEVRVDT